MSKRIFWIDNLRGFLILQTTLFTFFLPETIEAHYSGIARHASCFEGHMSYVDAGMVAYITIMGLALPLKFTPDRCRGQFIRNLCYALRRALIIFLCAPLLGFVSNVVQGQEIGFYWRDRVFLNLSAAYLVGFFSLYIPQAGRVFLVCAWILVMSLTNNYLTEARMCDLRYHIAWTGYGIVSLFSVHLGELHTKLFPVHRTAFAGRLCLYGTAALLLGASLYEFFGVRFNGIIVTPPYMLCSFSIAAAYLLLFSSWSPLRQRALPCLTGLGRNSLVVFVGLFIFRGLSASSELYYLKTPLLGIPMILLCGYLLEQWPRPTQKSS